MILRVLGSGSSGNCYLLDDGKQILIIEAGIPFAEVKEAIDYQTSRIVGVLSTHEHGDHRKFIDEYKIAGIDVVKGNQIENINDKNPLVTDLPCMFGNFFVSCFEVPHDVACYGYCIEHKDMGRLVFVTDAKYVKYTFPQVEHIMVEANYAQDILDENVSSGAIPESLRNRVMKSHMSFETAKGMVSANASYNLRNVIMCHLSSRNSDKKRFLDDMLEATGPIHNCAVHIATKGLEIPLNKYPF